MRLKWITAAVVLLMAALGFAAWKSSTQPAEQASAPGPSTSPDVPPMNQSADPGILWNAPAAWSSQGGGGMRLATYVVPGEGTPPAECAVYYFGPGQGGTTDDNIQRWLGEFENPQNPRRSSRTIRGLRVSQARVRGAYRSHGGSLAGEQGGDGPRGDQQLYGAIVEAPQGPVFFKLTGPAATVDRAAGDFDRMIATVRKK
jgi:hypothetical protein